MKFEFAYIKTIRCFDPNTAPRILIIYQVVNDIATSVNEYFLKITIVAQK